MATRPHTTPATDARNTPRDIVFDMEDDINDLRRLGATLMLLSETASEDEVQDALHQLARGLSDCHRDLKDKFKRLFDQIVRPDGGTPEPVGQDPAPPDATQEAKPEPKMVRVPVTQADVDLSYEVSDLLHVLKAAAENEEQSSSIAGVIQQISDKWFDCHSALEAAQAIEDRP